MPKKLKNGCDYFISVDFCPETKILNIAHFVGVKKDLFGNSIEFLETPIPEGWAEIVQSASDTIYEYLLTSGFF